MEVVRVPLAALWALGCVGWGVALLVSITGFSTLARVTGAVDGAGYESLAASFGLKFFGSLSLTHIGLVAVGCGLVFLVTRLEHALATFNEKLAASVGTTVEAVNHANAQSFDAAVQSALARG